MNLSPKQLITLRHMLGINNPNERRPRSYRNYAAVNPGDPELVELEQLGMVERYAARGDSCTPYAYYRCTDAGIRAAWEGHPSKAMTPARRRYLCFLEIRDSWNDLTFRKFLTNPELADARRTA